MKRRVALILCILLIASQTFVFAQIKQEEIVIKANNVTIIVKENAQSVLTESEIREFAEEFEPGEVITIYDGGYTNLPIDAGDNYYTNNGTVLPMDIVNPEIIIETVYGNWSNESVRSTSFVHSVAKGQTYVMEQTFTKTEYTKLSGQTPYGTITGGATVTAKVFVGTTLVGPPEYSTANSRDYYVKIWQKQRTWTQKKWVDGYRLADRVGQQSVPTKWSNYSVDRNY